MADITNLVIKIQANVKPFQSSMKAANQQVMDMQKAVSGVTVAAKQLNAVSFRAGIQSGINQTTDALTTLHTSLSTASSAALGLSTALKFTSHSAGLLATSSGMASVGLDKAIVSVVALKQTIGTLRYLTGLAAEGAAVLGSAFATMGRVALAAVNMALKPFFLLISLTKTMAIAAWNLVKPFIGVAMAIARLYLQFKAFILQLKILQYLFSALPVKIRAVVVGLIAIGAASRSLGIFGRLASSAMQLLLVPIIALVNPLMAAKVALVQMGAALQFVATRTVAAVGAIRTYAIAVVSATAKGTIAATAAVGRYSVAMGVGLVGAAMSAARSISFLAAAGTGWAVTQAAKTETLTTQFKVLLGSGDKATKMMKELTTYAAETPFKKGEIAETARSLLAFGAADIPAVMKEVRMMGELSAGTGNSMKELAEIYGRARVQGQLFAEDINQFTGRGIDILSGLSEQLGVNKSDIKKMTADGLVNFGHLEKAIERLTTGTGKYNGLTKELSKTTAGLWSTFTDNVTMAADAMGQKLLPYANDFLNWAISATEKVDGFLNPFSDAINWVADFVQSTQDGLADVGTAAGVIAANFDKVWKGTFQTLRDYAMASFDYVIANAKVMGSNIAEAFRKIPTMLKEGFKGNNPFDSLNMKESVAFKTPAANKALGNVVKEMNFAVDMQRAIRADERMKAANNRLAKVAKNLGPRGDADGMFGVKADSGVARQMKETKEGKSSTNDFTTAMQKGSAEAWRTILANMNGGSQWKPLVSEIRKWAKQMEKQHAEDRKVMKETKPRFAPEIG